MRYFVEKNGQLYRKSKSFCLFDSTLTFWVLKQILLDGNTWNYAQNTVIFIVRYDWNAMRTKLKISIYCMTLSLGWLWNKKQNLTQSAPTQVVSFTTAVITPALSKPINCICIALLCVNILFRLNKEYRNGVTFLRIFITPRMGWQSHLHDGCNNACVVKADQLHMYCSIIC